MTEKNTLMYPQASDAMSYQQIISFAAKGVDLPRALVEYVLLERMYRQTPDLAIKYIGQSTLHSLLCALKGEYFIVPGLDRLYLYFYKGSLTLSIRRACMSWHDLFRQLYKGQYDAGYIRKIEYILDRMEMEL